MHQERRKMKIQDNTVILPKPTEELLVEHEKNWRLKLPKDYKDFVMNYNGGIPEEKLFKCNEHYYEVTRFLCILKNVSETKEGWYDISVVESQIGERLTDNGDLIGVEVLPIAELFAGDYVCLDYRKNKEAPCVCIWSNDESGDFDPVTYKVANTFTDFITLLNKRILD